MKNGQQRFLVFVIWLAPLIAIPILGLTFIGAGLSPAAANLNPVDIIRLVALPLVSIVAFVAMLVHKNYTAWLIVGVCLPVLLSLVELAAIFIF